MHGQPGEGGGGDFLTKSGIDVYQFRMIGMPEAQLNL